MVRAVSVIRPQQWDGTSRPRTFPHLGARPFRLPCSESSLAPHWAKFRRHDNNNQLSRTKQRTSRSKMVMIKRTYRRQPTNDFSLSLSLSLITKKRKPASFYLGYDDDDEEKEEQRLLARRIKWQRTKATIALLAAACNAETASTLQLMNSHPPTTVRTRLLDWELDVAEFQNGDEGHTLKNPAMSPQVHPK